MAPITKILLIALLAIGYRAGRQYLAGCTCTKEGRLDGKTALVVAADTDIGVATVRGLARRGARVVMACQVAERCKTARLQLIHEFSAHKSGGSSASASAKVAEGKAREDSLKSASAIIPGQIFVRTLHLSSIDSIRNFCQKFQEEFKKVNILIVNAVHLSVRPDRTVDGFEYNMGTNFVASFLLTQHLLPMMEASANSDFLSRLVFVSSRLHQLGELPQEVVTAAAATQDPKYSWWRAFGSSQLALVSYANYLNTKVNPSKIRIVAVHPGFENGYFGEIFYEPFAYMMTWFGKTPWQAAQPALSATLMNPGERGVYFEDCVSVAPNAVSFNIAGIDRLVTQLNIKLAPHLPTESPHRRLPKPVASKKTVK